MVLFKRNGIVGTDGQYARIVFSAEAICADHPSTVVTHLKEIWERLCAAAAALAKAIINVGNGHVRKVLSNRGIVTIIPEQIA